MKKKKAVKTKKVKKQTTKKPTSRKVAPMPAKRKRRKSAKRTSVKKTVARIAKRGFSKIRKIRRTGRKMSGGAIRTEKPADFLIGVAVAALAGIAGSMVANKMPLPNPKLKAAIPLAAGVGLGMTKAGRNKYGKMAAIGLGVAGVLSLVNQFKPGLTTLAGDDVMVLPNNLSGSEMLGYQDGELMGISEELYGEELDGEDMDGEDLDGEDLDGEDLDGEDMDGEDLDGEDLDGEDLDGEDLDGEETLLGWSTGTGIENM